ncbi:MAG: PqqD family protein [Myxococcota bacterium]
MTAPRTVRPHDRLRAAGSPVERQVGDKVFVLTPDSRMHVLDNVTAVFLWRCIRDAGEAGVTAATLSRALARDFEVDEERAGGDARAFAEELLAVGVVERVA